MSKIQHYNLLSKLNKAPGAIHHIPDHHIVEFNTINGKIVITLDNDGHTIEVRSENRLKITPVMSNTILIEGS